MTSSHHGLYAQGYTRPTVPVTKGYATSQGDANPKKRAWFGSQAAIRLREEGIASNRGSACRGEYVPGSCTHRPSSHGSS